MATVMCMTWASSIWQTDIVNAAMKQKEKEGREDEREIHTDVRSLNSSLKQATITNYFSK